MNTDKKIWLETDGTANNSCCKQGAYVTARTRLINEKQFLYKELTAEIIKSAFNVHNTLGCGLLEKVYENSLAVELGLRKKSVCLQKEFRVFYKDRDVGVYYADMVVDDKVVIEIKAVEDLKNVHRAQLLNYLRISGLKVGLLINFAHPKLNYERFAI